MKSLLFALALAAAPARAAVVDFHLHLRMDAGLPLLFRGYPTEGPGSARKGSELFKNQVSLKDLREADVRLVMATLYAFPVVSQLRGGYLRELKRQARAVRDWADLQQGGAVLVRTPEEAEAVLKGKNPRLGLILAVEGTHGVLSKADLDSLWDEGVRMLTITHLEDSPWAGAAAVHYFPRGDCKRGSPPNLNRGVLGLTPLGRELLPEAVKKGFLIDLAHASDKTFEEARALLPGLPFIYSHEVERGLTPCERSVSREELEDLKKTGGMVGLMFRAAYAGARLEDLTEQAGALAALAGPENLALGSDFNGFIDRPDALANTDGLVPLLKGFDAAGLGAVRRSAERFVSMWKGYSATSSGRPASRRGP